MDNKIRCVHCGKTIEISKALKHQVEEQLSKNFLEKHEKELVEAEKKAEEKVRKELEERTSGELTDLKKQIEEKDKKMIEFREKEVELRTQARKIEEEKKEMKLEIERRLDEERKKIEDKMYRESQERQKYKDAEKEKIIADLRKSLEEARRRAEQGSQQMQGEIPELEIEEMLKAAFPTDEIGEVEKGVRGADIRQVVRTSMGNSCGVILWEIKQTKTWSDSWIQKLKDDLRAEKANVPVIISNTLPKEAESGMGLKDGVWVVNAALVLPLAEIIREKLREVAREKFIANNKDGDAEMLYAYITSHEFRQQIEAMLEVYQSMKEDIEKERRAFERIWSKREAQVGRLMKSATKVVGSIEGRVGSSMPQIKGLEFPELEEGGDSSESTS